MKINTTPDNPVIMGGVVGVSEFKIRNSAKAFSILSSGLYSNKIRAILREIGCNAVDSHVDAGRPDVPFDLHLPTQLAPYFSIRDYGTGLSHEQVVNVYTTYFESTKTESNDFIGALGLGSKSPFSYTDNFTVTAIKDGIKGVYSAYINEVGVPSVALMTSTQTDEPAGVEVMFAVEKDSYNFKKEATTVYRYFTVKPNLTGAKVDMDSVEYNDSIVLPRAKIRKEGHHGARAVMGNIAYPIDLSNNQSRDVADVLNAQIDLFFDIGEVEFQASREGLSYDKNTVATILARVREIQAVLDTVVSGQVDPITNHWARAAKLLELSQVDLLDRAVGRYRQAHKADLIMFDQHHRGQFLGVNLIVEDIAKQFNISVRMFEGSGYHSYVSEKRPQDWNGVKGALQFSGLHGYHRAALVINAASVNVIERIKYHLRNSRRDDSPSTMVLLAPVDKTQPMKMAEFLDSIYNPTADMFFALDDLKKKPPKVRVATKRVDVMRSEWDSKREEVFWRPSVSSLAELDDTVTYHYVVLKGFEAKGAAGTPIDIKTVHKRLLFNKLPGFTNIYGVRAVDLPAVQKMPNWVLLDTGVATALHSITKEQFYATSVKKIDRREIFQYIKKYVNKLIDPASPIQSLLELIQEASTNGELTELCKEFAPAIDPLKLEEAAHTEVNKMVARYPLLLSVHPRFSNEEYRAVADYITLIDQTRKV